MDLACNAVNCTEGATDTHYFVFTTALCICVCVCYVTFRDFRTAGVTRLSLGVQVRTSHSWNESGQVHIHIAVIWVGCESMEVSLSVQGISLCADRGNVPQVPVCTVSDFYD